MTQQQIDYWISTRSINSTETPFAFSSCANLTSMNDFYSSNILQVQVRNTYIDPSQLQQVINFDFTPSQNETVFSGFVPSSPLSSQVYEVKVKENFQLYK